MGYMPASDSDHVKQHEDGTDGNGGVGNVESPEVDGPPVNVDEVYDMADDDPVDEVAECAAQDQRQTHPRESVLKPELGAVDGDGQQCQARDYQHDHGLVREIDVVNNPKAAPVFCTCVRSRKPGMTFLFSPTASDCRTPYFVS